MKDRSDRLLGIALFMVSLAVTAAYWATWPTEAESPNFIGSEAELARP
ncbi:hypothetical protein SAMN05192583_0939 [Sphingomonas gellani]|uniref:Uncharacterized protein n=1 Tax=Sphingomonas gellani TaxID=1166340 RepID=A0A1H8AMN9_9SPHN|nr:hypothetical protein [Sphingomonas gellani]SEM70787.1 hypothetical protein SAMN05192583_0939 [Sphingomonas gellani]